jgi:hypothetical protein
LDELTDEHRSRADKVIVVDWRRRCEGGRPDTLGDFLE